MINADIRLARRVDANKVGRLSVTLAQVIHKAISGVSTLMTQVVVVGCLFERATSSQLLDNLKPGEQVDPHLEIQIGQKRSIPHNSVPGSEQYWW